MNNETEQIFLLNPSDLQPPNVPQKETETPTEQVNLENIEDFSTVCRLCATITEFVIPIFSGEGLQNNLADKIHKHLPIKVSEEDALPRAVCYQCTHTLLAWHELEACCRQADRALSTRLHQLQITQTQQDPKPAVNEDSQVTENNPQNELKPCRYTAHGGQVEHQYEIDIEIENKDANDTEDTPDLGSAISDDEPLSAIATTKKIDLYNNFYKALVNFRNHFVNDHKVKDSYPDITDSSDSEMMTDDRLNIKDEIDQDDVDNYDDLTQSNMRKDRMDDETRQELSEVQTKINGKVYYNCKICGKNLSSSHTYVFHKRIHTGERPCVCHVCGKQFRAPNGLQRHLTETHEKVRRHSCRFCPKNFANSQNLKQHMRIHTGERPFICSQCGKRFTQSGSLHVHLKTHNAQFPHQCAECGAKFRLRSGLTRHKLKHTGERPHICVVCGKGFRQKHELNSHSLSHTDSKPYTCALCGAAFRQRRALTHHSKRLHETDQNRDTSQNIARGPNMVVYTHIGQFEGIANIAIPPTGAPPEYPASSARPPLSSCPYCPSQHKPEDHREHLIQAHIELFFHCDECDTYVDRKDFILHMSFHVVQYSSEKKKDEAKKPGKKKNKVKDENENTESCQGSDVATENNEAESLEIEVPAAESIAGETQETNDDRDEFSDHSDTDFNFGPLPDSVFTAIEDSQDSQPADSEPAITPESIEGNIIEERDIENDTVNSKTDINMDLKSAEPSEQNTKKKIRKCHICGKVYTAPSSFFYHMKFSHKKTRDHECELCGRKFWTKVVLTQHMNTHSNICENECKICGKKLKSKSSLYIHTQNHIGTKKFSCEQCQISFRWRTHLLRHVKRHSAEKPHVCTTCGRGFTIRCDLLRHMKTHSAGKYECKKCGVSFAQVRYLKAHVDKKHSSQTEINHC